ncbi:MAG TPA: TetR/AcrR family transcriptional regulator [Solirubrobacterales bacterium]|nr:TetR/AcrR family transcriptional regulator [Solirubrobacterales bacterium]
MSPRPRTVSDEAVLDAALAIAGRAGPNAVTFARVAEEVGLSAATLVQRFGSKRGLLLAAARRGGPGRAEAWERARAAEPSPIAALLGVLGSFSAAVGSRGAMANSLAFLHLDLSDPEFHRLAEQGMEEMRERIRELLDAAIEAGELERGADTAELARAVQNAYNGALISWAIYGRGPVEDWLRREVEFVLAPFRAGA